LCSGDTRHPTLVFGLDVRDEVLEERIRDRAASMLERGVVEEARAALARPVSRSAQKVMGLVDFAELPPDEAREALVANNRRLARYQRKWMRRIPGLIALDGNRVPGEIAADMLGIARARGMLAA
jgi:tRNA dimethylallyltransferase